ncbi:MAG: hypothetical protein KBD76_12445 [Bacteriovorax sp.]|nr:hypothetical protein [Bacteriovorax sp.]
MKFIAFILLLSVASVQAQENRSLKDVMSDLGNSFKAVTLNLQAGIINSNTITEAENVVKYTIESEGIIPESILSLPINEQVNAKDKYDQEMKELVGATNELNNAIKANNLILAKQCLLQIGALKKQGHKDFK